jgi:hypothetical protein
MKNACILKLLLSTVIVGIDALVPRLKSDMHVSNKSSAFQHTLHQFIAVEALWSKQLLRKLSRLESSKAKLEL